MGNLSKCGITYIVLCVVFWYPFGISLEKTNYKHSCHGSVETFACNRTKDKISIYDLQYEKNCSSCKCASTTTCEKFELPGSWKNKYYYDMISGLQGSTFITQWVQCPISSISGALLYSNQVHLKYKCINEEKIIDFCELSGQIEGNIVYLQYARSVNRHQKRDCHCYASTSFGGLQIHAVDIRFPNNSLGICEDNENSYLQFDATNQSIQCEDKNLIGGYTTIFNTTKHNIEILLHLDGNPQSVWIGITALTGEGVNVSCKNTPPIEVLSTEAILSTAMASFDIRTSRDIKTSTISGPKGTNEIEKASTDITATTGENVNFSCKNTPPTEVVSTDAIIATAITIGNVRTSKAEETSTKKTNKAKGTTISSVPASMRFNSEKLIHTNEPHEITEIEYLSTASVNLIVPKETLPEKIKIARMLDPAIIVLILTGLLTLVLIIIAFVLGRSRYVQSRLDRKQSNAIREKIQLDSRETDLNMTPNHYTTFTSDIGSRLQPLVTVEDNSNIVYSEVGKKRRTDQLSNVYNLVNYQGSVKSVNSSINNTTDSYDHLHPNTNPRKWYGQYDTVEIGNCETDNETRTRNGVRQTSTKIPSEPDRDEQYINPYVDEAVIKGMLSDNELRRSLSSFIDVDESIRDMITHATNWAEEDLL